MNLALYFNYLNPDIFSGAKGTSDAERNKLLPRVLVYAASRIFRTCESDHITPCFQPSMGSGRPAEASCPLGAPCCFSPPCLYPRRPACSDCPLLLHPANSSFKTPLRGQLQEAFPAPPRLGKMPPVCVFIMELTTLTVIHSCVCVCVCVCVCPYWTVLPQARTRSFCSHL